MLKSIPFALATLALLVPSLAFADDAPAPAAGAAPPPIAAGAEAKPAAPAADKDDGDDDDDKGEGKKKHKHRHKHMEQGEDEDGKDLDGVRFRGGISGGGGGLFVSGFAAGVGGLDGRLGVQINDLVGLYVQPQFCVGAGKLGNGTGFTGTAGGSLVVDFTLADRFFVGVGGGGGVINNPAAGMVHFRVGGYPAMGYGANGIRRKGLMLGADVRIWVASGITVLSPMASIGYEAF